MRYLCLALICGCTSTATNVSDAAMGGDGGVDLAGGGGGCGTLSQCADTWEENASNKLDGIAADPTALAEFVKAVPKGGDLHNHLSGAIYAETLLGWGKSDNNCINTTTFAAVSSGQCSASTMPVPDPGMFYDQIVRAWSMKDFVPGTESGHDHFFATFGKFGTIAGTHRFDGLADLVTRAADENQLYIETMFNMGTNVGGLAASVWSGAVTAGDLQSFYDMLTANAGFAGEVASDANTARTADSGWKSALGCSGMNPPAACQVSMRFVAQISRTGSNDQIFGQLVGAFEAAKTAPQLVGANLSSPEDDTRSLDNYDLHMAMLDFLHTKYAGQSPLHITLHAGELTAKYLPASHQTANTFHIRRAVEVAHAERIGHGLDVLSETDPNGLMDEMKAKGVLVEVCLSSNDQILEVKGTDHPLAQYLSHGVPVALATDDQGVSRSSLAGEYLKAVVDQKLRYRQLKQMARNSLEHSFLPGASLWATPTARVADCELTGKIDDAPTAACQTFLDANERAKIQWELERRFLVFESQQ